MNDKDDTDVLGSNRDDAMLPRVSISERHSSVSSNSPGGSHGQSRSSSVSAGRCVRLKPYRGKCPAILKRRLSDRQASIVLHVHVKSSVLSSVYGFVRGEEGGGAASKGSLGAMLGKLFRQVIL